MIDSELNEPERHLQPRFSFKALLWLGIPALLALPLEGDREDDFPTRTPRPPATARIAATALPLPAGSPLGGLWALRSDEPRFGGLSGLAWDRGALLAVSDSGVVIRWPAPGGPATFRDLPAGPGLPQWKINRDAEGLVRDSAGRGWWVSFEQHHGAWLFDPGFTRALGHRPVRLRTWWRNWGVEALLSRPDGLLLLPEDGGEAIRVRNEGEARVPLFVDGAIGDAVSVGEGATVVTVRTVRPWGIANRLGTLEEGAEGLRVHEFARLPLGRFDNVEGLALEPRPDGSERLWFVTDSDFRRRTLLGWIALPTTKAPARTGALDR